MHNLIPLITEIQDNGISIILKTYNYGISVILTKKLPLCKLTIGESRIIEKDNLENCVTIITKLFKKILDRQKNDFKHYSPAAWKKLAAA